MEIIATLRRHEQDLHRRRAEHAALFGSIARGDGRPDSDIDILIELDPNVGISVFDYVGIKDYIADLFDGRVDVVNKAGLKPHVRPAVLTDVVYAF